MVINFGGYLANVSNIRQYWSSHFQHEISISTLKRSKKCWKCKLERRHYVERRHFDTMLNVDIMYAMLSIECRHYVQCRSSMLKSTSSMFDLSSMEEKSWIWQVEHYSSMYNVNTNLNIGWHLTPYVYRYSVTLSKGLKDYTINKNFIRYIQVDRRSIGQSRNVRDRKVHMQLMLNLCSECGIQSFKITK